MRITYVTETYPPEINGVALSVERAVRHLRAAGHALLLVRPRQRGEAPEPQAPAGGMRQEWRSTGLPIPLYPDLRFGLARPASLRRLWQQPGARPDLVHVATPGPLGWAALKAAQAEGIPATADFRTNFHAYSHHYGLGWLAPAVLAHLRRLHAMAECNFVPTPALAAQLQAEGFERLQVLGRGVDLSRFHPGRRDAALRRQWQAGPADPVLLHVGRLAAEKNVQLALACFERLRLQNPRLRMVVVGEGPQRQALQRRHPQVLFAGLRTGDDLARHYASADVFLFPSLTDTFGNVTLEAMASGLAVAAFDTAAAGLHLRDGVSGCLAAPLAGAVGEAAFLHAVQRALLAVQPPAAMRWQALLAARHADWDSVLGRFEQQLRQVAGRAPQPGWHAAVA